jgi:hypothetical protein
MSSLGPRAPACAWLIVCRAMLNRPRARVAAGVIFSIAVSTTIALACGTATAHAAGCKFGSFSAKHPPKACWRPFSADSPFNRELPPTPREAAASPLIAAVTTGFGSAPAFEVGNAGTPDDFQHPVYFSSPNDPVYRVDCLSFGGRCEIDGHRVRIPRRASPAGGSDGHLGVIDQKSGWSYDFWQVRERPEDGGRLAISYGGRTKIGSQGSDGLGSNATAAHFATSAGAIRPEELRAGLIDHALFMTVKCTSGRSVWPAGDGVGQPCSGLGLHRLTAPAMGQHFFLKMSNREIERLGVARWQKTILVAMADYGLFVGDTGGISWGFKLWTGLGGRGETDPWVKLARRFEVPTYVAPDGTTRYVFDLKQTLDWTLRLRVAAPCVSRRSC